MCTFPLQAIKASLISSDVASGHISCNERCNDPPLLVFGSSLRDRSAERGRIARATAPGPAITIQSESYR